MSASSKKKLRKEQNAALSAEKQKNAKKESRNLKLSSAIFLCAIVAILVAGITLIVVSSIKSTALIERKTTALTIDGDHELNSIQMAYYYIDTLDNQITNNSMMLTLQGLDMTKPLDEQEYKDDQTWADYFVELAATRARDEYALRKAAEKAGFTLSDDYVALLESQIKQKSLTATLTYGYANLDDFLSASYCNGANEASYREYLYTGLMAEAYYTYYGESLTFTDEQRREHDKDTYNHYSSYSYASYFIGYTNYLPEGVSSSTATEEQIKTALAEAKAEADSLNNCTNAEELNAAIAQLSFNKDKDSKPTCNENEDILYSGITTILQEWITHKDRKAGDFTVIANETTSTDADGNEKKTTSGYTVVIYKSTNDNNFKLSNVRHLLVAFEGGTYDANTQKTTYSEAEKKAAKDKAEKLLAQWKAGAATEASFIELVKKETDDTASIETGGLYEEISPSSSYVTNFRDWAVNKDRKAGDVGIVETEYGYHIMYFSGYADITYRDSMINTELLTEAMDTWYTEVTEAIDMKVGNTRHLNTSIVLQPED